MPRGQRVAVLVVVLVLVLMWVVVLVLLAQTQHGEAAQRGCVGGRIGAARALGLGLPGRSSIGAGQFTIPGSRETQGATTDAQTSHDIGIVRGLLGIETLDGPKDKDIAHLSLLGEGGETLPLPTGVPGPLLQQELILPPLLPLALRLLQLMQIRETAHDPHKLFQT